MSSTTLAIEISGLSVVREGITVLEDISLSIRHGDFLGIIGPNGGGKTTLLRVLLGLLSPTAGTVRVLGRSPKEIRGEVGYVPQYARFDRDFPISVFDVVLTGRLSRSLGWAVYSKEDRRIARNWLARLGIAELEERGIRGLSGGELQRVLIARALAMEPRLLLLDEPTASVDTPGGRSVYSLLDDISSDTTVVLVSHDIGVISSHVRSIACLNRRLYFHPSREIAPETLEEVYGCGIDLIAHGQAHRVLGEHRSGEEPRLESRKRSGDSQGRGCREGDVG